MQNFTLSTGVGQTTSYNVDSPNYDLTLPNEPQVTAVTARVGHIRGAYPAGFLTVQICQYDSTGTVIDSLDRNVSIPMTDDMQTVMDSYIAGTETAGQMDTLNGLILQSTQAQACGIR
jgi:hypothetical protein